MRCKTCDYPLWNLKARQCPECGTPFKPSDYEFIINSVKFCCPQCDQQYYGTGVKGHLVPDAFDCVKCGMHLRMDDMKLQPAEGVHEQQTQVDGLPWLERHRRGFFSGWFSTWIQSMGAPARLARGLPGDSPQGQAWLYAVITLGFFLFCGALLPMAVFALAMLASGKSDFAEPFLVGLGLMFFGTLSILALAWIWGLVTHGMLRITGGCEHGLSRTIQIILYGCGTQTALAIPIINIYCGLWFFPIWWIVAAITMVVAGQRVQGGRATLAVLTFPAAFILSTIGLYALALYMAMSSAPAFGPIAFPGKPGALSPMNAFSMTQSLRLYALANNGSGPEHAVMLLAEPRSMTSASEFVLDNSSTRLTAVPVDDTTLDQFQSLGQNRRRIAAKNAGDSLPDDVIAHRLGDFVFTHHGVNFNDESLGLWTLVCTLDPSCNPSAMQDAVVVGLVDGRTQAFLPEEFDAALAEQNILRAAAGLPALGDPRLVIHESPMTPATVAAEQSLQSTPSNDLDDMDN